LRERARCRLSRVRHVDVHPPRARRCVQRPCGNSIWAFCDAVQGSYGARVSAWRSHGHRDNPGEPPPQQMSRPGVRPWCERWGARFHQAALACQAEVAVRGGSPEVSRESPLPVFSSCYMPPPRRRRTRATTGNRPRSLRYTFVNIIVLNAKAWCSMMAPRRQPGSASCRIISLATRPPA